MLLTSLNRLYYYISTVESASRDTLTKNAANNSQLLSWATSISDEIERYLDRSIEKKSYVKYFNTDYRRRVYYPKATPITSITSIEEDSEGLFNGGESEVDNTSYFIGADNASIVVVMATGKRRMRVTYVGGMAAHAVNSIFAVTESEAWTVDKYCYGQSSGAMGLVKAQSSGSLTIENLYGTFTEGEQLTQRDEEDSVGASTATASLDSVTERSLAEAYPAIVRAVEMEVRYMWKHKMDMENDSTQFEGTRRRDYELVYKMQPEVQMMLRSYRMNLEMV